MKQKKVISFTLVLALLIGLLSIMPAANAVTNEVSLIYAKPVTEGMFVTAGGYIEVANLGYDKAITVHYTTNGTTWYDAEAEYYKPTWGNREAWTFQTGGDYHGYRGTVTVTFAIKYEVNGQVYWDNNNGQNYKVKAGYGISNQYDFGAGAVAYMSYAKLYEGTRIYMQLKDIAYDKDVKVRYTTDNWETYEEVSGYYVSSFTDSNVQMWEAYVPTLDSFDFAISYTVNGTTYWDNNFGDNYTIE